MKELREIIHKDFCGPLIIDIGGEKKSFTNFIDDYFRYT